MFDILWGSATAVSGSAMLAAATSYCTFNGKSIPCPDFSQLEGPIMAMVIGLYALVILGSIVAIISNWVIYKKASQPGWASIVPIYNMVIMIEIVGKPVWWILLLFIPVVNVIIGIIMVYRLSLSFGKGVGFTIGMIFLPIIFFPILAFGHSQFHPLSDSASALPPQEPPKSKEQRTPVETPPLFANQVPRADRPHYPTQPPPPSA